MTILEKIQKGIITEKKIIEPEGKQHCLNCGADFEGAFCPHCGQYWRVQRVTARSILDLIVTNITSINANMPRTILDLFYRPGYLIADYLRGRRKNYSNPFSLIFVLAALFLILDQYAMQDNVREASIEYSNAIGEGLNKSLGTEDHQYDSNQYTPELLNLIYDHLGLFSILMIPMLTLPFWLAYRKKGQYRDNPINIYESTIVIAFISCQNLVVNLLSMPFITPDNMGLVSTIGYLIVIPLFLLSIWQMFQMKTSEYIISSILFGFYLIITIIISGIAMSIGFGVYFMMK